MSSVSSSSSSASSSREPQVPCVASATTADRRVAIVGYACTIPGAEDVCGAWDVVREGVDAITDIPADRMDVTAFWSPDKTAPDKVYCKRGGFIPDFDFDPREFNTNMRQLEDTDANQTLTLIKVRDALRDAGIDPSPARPKSIGCVLAIGGGQKLNREVFGRMGYAVVDQVLRSMAMDDADVAAAVNKFKAHYPEWRLDSFPGSLGNVTAGRVTNVFNLDGMNCVVDAACASSLAALKVAIEELHSGNCRAVLTGSTCTDNSLGMYMSFSKTPVFTTAPNVSAYDSRTAGMLIGEGSVVFVLKRLCDAIQDGDRVHAVIRGVGCSSDGRASGIYSPVVAGQELALRRAYSNSGVNPATVTLVEGHGTGTPVGDIVELTSHSRVFDSAGAPPQSIAIGSIKSNVGHLKAAAGFAGLLKAVLALEHKTLPKTINVSHPPVHLQDGHSLLAETSLYVNTRNRPWFPPSGVPRRAGVSAFGFGGANYHAVLEEFEAEHSRPYRLNACPIPVLLSAPTPADLQALAEREAASLETALVAEPATNARLQNLRVHESFCQRFALPALAVDRSAARVGFLATTAKATIATLKSIARKLSATGTGAAWNLQGAGVVYRARALVEGQKDVAAMFVGQGATHPYMFDEVAMNWPPFRRAVVDMEAAQHRLAAQGAVPVSSLMFPPAPYDGEPPVDATVLSDTRNAQPAVIAASVGAYDIFSAAGFSPGFLAGHSLGELAALSIAGAFDRSTLCDLVARRAESMCGHCSQQSMAAVLSPRALEVEIATTSDPASGVWLANTNSPSQVVISGTTEAVSAESQRLTSAGFRVVPLVVSGAFHTPLMQPAAASFLCSISGLPVGPPTPGGPRVFSNVTGREFSNKDLQMREYLAEHIRSPVRFMDEVLAMYQAGVRLFVEFGPGKTLSGLIGSVLAGSDEEVLTVAVNPSKKRCPDVQLREAAVALAVAGVPLSNFDPWAVRHPLLTAPEVDAKRRKGIVRLSAATYVSRATLEERSRILNDGYHVHVHAPSQAIPPPPPPSNGLELMTWHPLSGVRGNPTPGFWPTALKPRPVRFLPFPGNPSDVDYRPGKFPLSWYNLWEFCVGRVSRCLGEEFAEFDGLGSSRSPGFDLQLITRVLSASEMGLAAGGRVISEFDCPGDAWFYQGGLRTPVPYSIIMELALQASGILTSWSRMPLILHEGGKKLLYRNLDATAEMLRHVDCRGKTVTTECCCTGSSLLGRTAIQKFTSVLSVDGAPFYRTQSSFGWFDSAAFDTQLGLDNGVSSLPWVLSPSSSLGDPCTVESYALPVEEPRIFQSVPQSLRRTEPQLCLLDKAIVVVGGGSFGKGYAYGHKAVDAQDWFFACHFWGDPVMPGSLGVEAMFQLMEYEMARSGCLPGTGQVAGWSHCLGVTKWKYRGQLTPRNKEMEVEIHVKSTEVQSDGSSAVIVADGFLWVDKLRIYAITDMRLAAVTETSPRSTQQTGASQGTADMELLVLETLAKATGYDQELIEPGMDLEQELGIDSIKRVEILSTVQSKIGGLAQPQQNEALLAARTVRDVMQAISGGSSAASAVVGSAPPTVVAVERVVPTDMKALVLETLAKATGYDQDLIEPEMDLEQELGIDSIKRVEILSTVQSRLGGAVQQPNEALLAARTVHDVVQAVSGLAPAVTLPSAPATTGVSAVSVKSTGQNDMKALVLETLAKATGYDQELIEPDMDLEQELGIDSIKRVEILSTVQSKLGGLAQPQQNEALLAARTVRDVVQAISGLAPAVTASPTAPPTTAVPAVAATHSAPSGGVSDMKALVFETLAKATGYDQELIEPEMDLEQELGIDSIKRVEILSTVQSKLGSLAQPQQNEALLAARTVRDVVQAISGMSPATTTTTTITSAPPTAVAAKQTAATDQSDVKALVFETLAKATGYDQELIEPDMDLERELGIDSIKRVEILSTVQSKLGKSAKENDALLSARTVGDVIGALAGAVGSHMEKATPSQIPAEDLNASVQQQPAAVQHSYTEPPQDQLDLSSAAPRGIPVPCRLDITWPRGRPVLITDGGTYLTTSLERRLAAIGLTAVVITFPAEPRTCGVPNSATSVLCVDRSETALAAALKEAEEHYGTPVGFIQQHNPSLPVADQLRWALLAAKHLSRALHVRAARTFFFCVTRVDGQLGLGGLASAGIAETVSVAEVMAAAEGGVYGLCKTLALEWKHEVLARGIDLAPSLADDDAALCIERELLCSDLTLHETGWTDLLHRFTIEARRCSQSLDSAPPGLAGFGKDSVVMVSGGARGITPACIAALASLVGGGSFFLLGRSRLEDEPQWAYGLEGAALREAATAWLKTGAGHGGPAPTIKAHNVLVKSVEAGREIRRSLDDLSRCGARAQFISCDVNDFASLRAAFETATACAGPITGLIHASGIVHDKRVEAKSPEDFDVVYGVKIGGLRNLLDCFSASSPAGLEGLRQLVVFSSLAGFHGNGGQTDYSMANDALSKVAHRVAHRLPSCFVSALCFGPWDGGMVTPVLKAHFQACGVQIIPRDGGARLVSQLLSPGPGIPTECQWLIGNMMVPPIAPWTLAQTVSLDLQRPTGPGDLNSALLSHVIQDRLVMPMTVAIGYLANSVLRIYPGWALVAVKDSYFYRSVSWDAGDHSPLSCRIRIEPPSKAGSARLSVEAMLSASVRGRVMPAFKAKVLLGPKWPAAPVGTSIVVPRRQQEVLLDAAAIYGEGKALFHGPLFQGVDVVTSIGADSIEAVCHQVPLSSVEMGQLDAGPVAEDSFTADISFQVVIIWVITKLKQAALPVFASSVELFSPRLARGEKYYASCRITKHEGQLVETQVDLHNSRGSLFCRASGSVTLSPTMSYFTAKPKHEVLCEPPRFVRDPQVDRRIAVVGMAVRFPGVPDNDSFWKLLLENRSTDQPIDAVGLHSEDKSVHMRATPRVPSTLSDSSYSLFEDGVPSGEHELLLSVARRALADAHMDADSLGRCGIVNGSLMFPGKDLQNEFMTQVFVPHLERMAGSALPPTATSWGRFDDGHCKQIHLCDPASFVASQLGLAGGCPTYCIDAACATALYNVKLCQDHLLSGEADTMLCCATQVADPFFIIKGFSLLQVLPTPAGRSAPLSSGTTGLLAGEGCVVLVFKRLGAAVAAKDHIYGVVRDVAILNAGTGLPLRPTVESEVRCLCEAYASAGLAPSDVQYVECHATGTPVGDEVELRAVDSFYGSKPPLLGSIKSNFGHTLSVAGLAAMCKSLLAMREGVIPATPRITKAAHRAVVSANMSWPVCEGLRRAGVSAFGFGGTCAHAIVEEFRAASETTVTAGPTTYARGGSAQPLAIVGMAAHFGTLQNLAEFERAVFYGTDGACQLPDKRWRSLAQDPTFMASIVEGKEVRAEAIHGCFVESVGLDYKKLGLSMLAEDQLRQQHLLALSVVNAALEDSLGAISKGCGARVAVLVGMGTDMEIYRERARDALYERLGGKAGPQELNYMSDSMTHTSMMSDIGNILATRISSLWGFTGPSFAVTCGANSVHRCLEIGAGLLSHREADAVVVAGVDMNGSAEAVWAHVQHGGSPKLFPTSEHPCVAFSQSSSGTGLFVGEGAGAFVIKRCDDIVALAASKNPGRLRVYATIDSIASGSTEAEAASRALSESGVNRSEIELVEVSAGSAALCCDELTALSKEYKTGSGADSEKKRIALGSVRGNVGDCGYATGSAAIIKAALCIYNRYLSQVPRWDGPLAAVSNILDQSPFICCTESHAWIKNSAARRRAAISGAADEMSPCLWFHLLLSDFRAPGVECCEAHNVRCLDAATPLLVVFRGASTAEIATGLQESLKRAQGAIGPEAELRGLVSQTVREEAAVGGLALSLIATAGSLVQELGLALQGVRSPPASTWRSPAGSFFTTEPLRSPEIAFAYGDIMAPYAGLGKELFRIAPQLHEALAVAIPDIDEAAAQCWDVNVILSERVDAVRSEVQLVPLLMSEIFHSACFSMLAERILRAKPKYAFGLSLGETCMMHYFSPANLSRSALCPRLLMADPIFNTELCGPMKAIRNAWAIAADVPTPSFWQGYAVMLPRQTLEEAIASRGPKCHVRLTVVPSPGVLIVAGDPHDCVELFEALGAKFTPIPNPPFCGHCPEVVPYFDGLVKLHSYLELPAVCDKIALFSAMEPEPLGRSVKQASFGEDMAKLLATTADFPQLVSRVYDHGARVFVEVGAQNLRTLAIGSTLGGSGQPHLAVALDRKGEDQWRCVLKAAAQLVSHGIPGVHIGGLYHPTLFSAPQASSPTYRNVQTNGRFSGKLDLSSAACPDDLQREVDFQRGQARSYKGPLVWNYDDLLEFAEGCVAPVFNKRPSGEHPPWSLVDTFARRVRLPARDYLLVSRVTHMDAVTNRFERSTIRTEYDLPVGGALSEGGDIPAAVLVESGQCDLMLISYLGIDFRCHGDRVYRLLDTTLTFHGVAQEGQTLCYDISIDSFARTGDQVSMMFFQYNCFVEGKLLIEMRNGVAGFFTDEELAAGRGITHTDSEVREHAGVAKRDIRPWLRSPGSQERATFSQSDIRTLLEDGGWGRLIPGTCKLWRKLCSPKILMIDEVPTLDPFGGVHGLGLVVGEKRIDRDSWFFPCHFRGDQVMAGSLVSEGCFQLLKLYLAWLGLAADVESPVFRPMHGRAGKVRCRGQISPHRGKLVYVMEVKDVGIDAATGFPYAVADFDIVDVNEELGQVYCGDSWNMGPNGGKVVVDFKNLALWIEGTPRSAVQDPILDVDRPCTIANRDGGPPVILPAVTVSCFGSPSFLSTYGVKYPLYLGAMAKGIGSVNMAIAAGRRGIMASLGTGGLSLQAVEKMIEAVHVEMPQGPFAVNLIHSPYNPELEMGCVDIFLQHRVHVVEASAFMSLTPAIVRFRVAGLSSRPDGSVACVNKVLFKLSRTEIAEFAMRPPPKQIVDSLAAEHLVTREQAALACHVPMADDIVVEADSGGHTDNRPLNVIFPVIRSQARRITTECKYRVALRVGAAGGIGSPDAAAAAFHMGAAFIVTGTVNQLSRQSGVSDPVREMLASAKYTDVAMAPSADMFDQGVQVQVLKGKLMFVMRANKLYSLYSAYPSLEAIPAAELAKLESVVFRKPVAHIWSKTVRFFTRAGQLDKVQRAEANPKLKMSLVFGWYLGKSSQWAIAGKPSRKVDYQVWCGPAIGAYNEWVAGSVLDPAVSKCFPCVVQQNLHLLRGACYLERISMIQREPGADIDVEALPPYVPAGTL